MHIDKMLFLANNFMAYVSLYLNIRLPLLHSIQEIREFRLFRNDDYTFHSVPIKKM